LASGERGSLVIVVDSDSSDGTVAYARAEHAIVLGAPLPAR
jgi:hypothetical protein